MNQLTGTFVGVVHGKTIELAREPGLPDGQVVNVLLTATPANGHMPGDGLRRAFGAWSDDDDGLAEFLTETRRGRQRSRRELGT